MDRLITWSQMMARTWLWQTLVDIFKRVTSTEVPSSSCGDSLSLSISAEHYIELARKCMAHAKKMSSARDFTQLQFNHRQCAHLANKLEAAVEIASSSLGLNRPERNEEAIGIFKHLYRCAKEIETFIQSCGEAKWVQAAVVLSNVYNSEHVSSLDFYLDFCLMLVCDIDKVVSRWSRMRELGVRKSKDILNDIVAVDQRALVSRLEAMNQVSSEPAAGRHQLVRYLLQRLRHRLSQSVDSKAWEIDLSSLKQVQTLGSGSFGTVRKSIWLGVEVAEKTFHATGHQSGFRNEVRILAGLTHPNIVPLLGYGMDKRGCSIVMELMDGDLKLLMDQRLRLNPSTRVPFSIAEAVDKMLQTAEGMLYLHENKVVHRDLKSQNILVKYRKYVDGEYINLKVADFGLSKTKEKSSSYSNQTENTGTTRWMAPELMRQGDQVGEESRRPFKVDVYSFGMVCSEILTGEIPFSSISSLGEVRKMVLEGQRPQLPADCRADLRDLIVECWDSNASQRPSFAEICKRLRRVKYLIMRVPSSPERYLELARKCMAHAKEMSSARDSTQLQFNHGQCVHLANKLEAAVIASLSLGLNRLERNEEAIGIFKHLYRCAKKIETFIQSCGEGMWVQAAVVQSNVYNYEHVCSLDFDLDFCLTRLCCIDKVVSRWSMMRELGVRKSKDFLNEIVTGDQRALVSRLEVMNQESSEPAAEMHQLARYLSQRLRHRLRRTFEPEAWEIDLSSLKPLERPRSGSFGAVRKSIWLGVEVAEKRFQGTDDQLSFRNEVRVLAGLTHPNIVRLLGYGMDERGCSVVMELMDGDLNFLLDQRFSLNPFSIAEAVDKMLQTAEGMLYLHENNVVHRDLKSSNILVKCRKDVDGEYIFLKVADFGLSRTKEKSSSYSNLPAIIGTTRWMAPELMRQGDQAGEELRYPFEVDVYSFGMVCSEILTGEIPFSSIGSPSEVKRMVLEGQRPQLPADCRADLRDLIVECWDSNASQRPSFAEICRTLRRLKFLLLGGSVDKIDALLVAHERLRKERVQKENEKRALACEKEREKGGHCTKV